MPNAPSISICIPAYDMGGQGADFLRESFERMVMQSFRDFEVVVSDQSDGEDIEALCREFAGRLNLRHVYFREGKRQASANCNNAMRHATGAIIKVLFQDDLLASEDALGAIGRGFESGADWLLTGSAVTRDGATVARPMVPRMHPQIRFGKNTVSSPSVLAMRRESLREFDEHLIWLMDVEMYHRLQAELGPPLIVPETLILNRLHEGQVSSGVTPELRRRELAYVRKKHRAGETLKDRLAFYKQVLKAR